jgi:hypothetical protein
MRLGLRAFIDAADQIELVFETEPRENGVNALFDSRRRGCELWVLAEYAHAFSSLD